MNVYKHFKFGRSYRKNARFGILPFIGAHRFVYYMGDRPYYFYSDRPYTIKDAKAWKIRNLIIYAVLTVGAVSLLFDRPMNNLSETVNLILNIGLLIAAVFCAFRTFLFIIVDPQKDPMLQSSQCDDQPGKKV